MIFKDLFNIIIMSHIFVIKNVNDIIGIYNTYNDAEINVFSLLQNKLINNIMIYKYILNSGYCIESYSFNNKIKINNTKINNTRINNEINMTQEEKDTLNKISQDKILLQHDINMLKIEKQRLEESKDVYISDIKLYNLFKNKIMNDVNFKLPELFNDKYIIFKKLDLEQNLSWETFTNIYNTSNNYDNYFMENKYENKEILEEIIIDSE
jgi:hypothetical protein